MPGPKRQQRAASIAQGTHIYRTSMPQVTNNTSNRYSGAKRVKEVVGARRKAREASDPGVIENIGTPVADGIKFYKFEVEPELQPLPVMLPPGEPPSNSITIYRHPNDESADHNVQIKKVFLFKPI